MQKWRVIPYALLQLSHVPDFQGCVLVLKNHTPAVSPSFCIAVLTRLQIPSQGSILQWEKNWNRASKLLNKITRRASKSTLLSDKSWSTDYPDQSNSSTFFTLNPEQTAKIISSFDLGQALCPTSYLSINIDFIFYTNAVIQDFSKTYNIFILQSLQFFSIPKQYLSAALTVPGNATLLCKSCLHSKRILSGSYHEKV